MITSVSPVTYFGLTMQMKLFFQFIDALYVRNKVYLITQLNIDSNC